jgi:hypothetical protein
MDGGSTFVRGEVSDRYPGGLDVGRDLLGPFAVAAVDHYRAALLGEHAGDALSDPAAAACDECAPAFELKIHSVPPPVDDQRSLRSNRWGDSAYSHMGIG